MERFEKISLKVILSGAKTLEIERDGKPMTIQIPSDFAGKLIKFKDVYFMSMRVPSSTIDSFKKNSPAELAGIKRTIRSCCEWCEHSVVS
jgi:regulator of sigma E protease